MSTPTKIITCPKCGGKLRRVEYDPHSMFNRDQGPDTSTFGIRKFTKMSDHKKIITCCQMARVGDHCCECSAVFDKEELALSITAYMPTEAVGLLCARCCQILSEKLNRKRGSKG